MITTFIFFQIFLLLTKNSCVFRSENDKIVNYTGPPVALDDASVSKFIDLCSSLLPQNYKKGDPISSCCAPKQLSDFKKGIEFLKNTMSDCGICKENIQRLTCYIVCQSNQSDYIIPHFEANTSTVSSIKLMISHDFAKGLFNSCKDVKLPSYPVNFITTVCNQGTGQCTPNDFVKSLLFYSPLEMDAQIVEKNQTFPPPSKNVLDIPYLLCNESYSYFDKTIPTCSCQDCVSACPPPIPLPNDTILLFLGKLTLFQSIILFFYILFVFGFCLRLVLSWNQPMDETLLYEDNINDFEPENTYTTIETPDINFRMSAIAHNFQTRVQKFIQRGLTKWGVVVSSNKIVFTLFPLIILIALCSGVFSRLQFTSDPLEIWSPPNSKTRQNKEIFDKNFGPFYRTEQIIIKAPKFKSSFYNDIFENVTFGPPINSKVIDEIFRIQTMINKINVTYVNSNKSKINVSFTDVCFKPMTPVNNNCAFFSITQYFQNDPENLKKKYYDYDWRSHLYYCIHKPISIKDTYFGFPCLSDFFAPVTPELVFGGYDSHPNTANSLVITYILNNNLDNKENENALAWETALLDQLKKFKSDIIEISFNAERSVQDEIDRQTHAEITTVSLSYIIMFIYVSLFLGSTFGNGIKVFIVKQKILVSFSGVILVFLSVTASIGLFSFCKLKLNMIVLEVLPFLLLAIGVDNIFLMVDKLRKIEAKDEAHDTPTPLVIGEMLGSVGQGIFVSAIAQISCFCIAAVSNIPAVRTFSLVSAAAVAINFFMQMTVFLVVLTLDLMRERSNRPDILCCFGLYLDSFQPPRLSFQEKLFNYLSTVILSTYIRPVIIFIFVTFWFACAFISPSVEKGLDQTIALPSDSYLQPYFHNVFSELRSGPPVYFMVMPGFSYENTTSQKLICSGSDCSPDSLVTTIYRYSQHKDSMIATPANSWLDTYLSWLKTHGKNACCKYRIESNKTIFCPSYETKKHECDPCIDEHKNITSDDFVEYLPWFLEDIPTLDCPLGGKPLYKRALVLNPDRYKNHDKTKPPILMSHFMSYHTSLGSGHDLIKALQRAEEISDRLTRNINKTVIPYSVFYVFYESVMTIWNELSSSFALSFVVLIIVNAFMYGFEMRITFIITALIYLMNVVNIGFMYILGINLNPVSLVNLIMFLGLNVEFVSHICRAYISVGIPNRIQKAQISLIKTGSSVFSGITLTKILGVSVLYFSKSALFRTYYFKMYACAIIVGALHGLILLPVLLSYLGPVFTPEPIGENTRLLDEQD